MNESRTILHQELKKIANMQSLVQSRIFTLVSSFLIMFYYFAYHYGLYCLYIFFFSLFAPTALELAFGEKKFNTKKQVLPVLKEVFGFNLKHYYCLYITFWMSNILLAVWQFNVMMHPTEQKFANIFPTVLLTGNIFFFLLSSYYYRFKLHYQLLNNRW